MSTLSLRKIKHDSSAVDNITLDSNGRVGVQQASPNVPFEVGGSWRLGTNTSGTYTGGLGGGFNPNNNIYSMYCRDRTDTNWNDLWIEAKTLSLKSNGSNTAIYIDQSGRVTMPYQPAFNARKNNGQTLNTNGTDVKIEYNNVATNIGNHYSAANDRFTAPVNGLYHFSAFFMFNSFPTDYQYAFIRFLRNGSDAMESEVMLPRPSGGLFATSIITMNVYLAANDYIEVYARQSGGSSNMGIREAFGVFSGYLVG